MQEASEMISIVGVRIPDFIVAVLLILSGFLGYLIDQRLSGWIYPVRLMAGLGAMIAFGVVVSSFLFVIQAQRYGMAPGWSHVGVTMLIASGTGQIAGGGFFTILVVRLLAPAVALGRRAWTRAEPHLRAKSPD